MRKLFLFVFLLFGFGLYAQTNINENDTSIVNSEINSDSFYIEYKKISLFESNDYNDMSKQKLFDEQILVDYILVYQDNNIMTYKYSYYLRPTIQCDQYLEDLMKKCKVNYPESSIVYVINN